MRHHIGLLGKESLMKQGTKPKFLVPLIIHSKKPQLSLLTLEDKVSNFQHGLCCRQSMIFYRGKNNIEWESEMHSIIELAEQSCSKKKIGCWGNLEVLKSPTFLKPLGCVSILYMMHVSSGFMMITLP